MGEDQMFSRFDDIWCGVILLKVCHHLNLLVAVGEPFVNHSRASNCFVNLIKEAAGIQRNETFWKVIDDIPMVGSTPSECMLEIADGLQKTMDEYYVKLGKAISIWVKLVGG
jgi:hypothetical protein